MTKATVSTHRRPPRLPRLAFLKQVPPTLAWVLCAMALVLSWGLIDPGHTRQRMDWSIGDRWLAHRTPPSLHNDIVLVLEDDVAAAELGHTNARHRRARALRQLRRLRARTVVFDFLLLDTGSEVSFYNDEAHYDGLPTRQLVQDTLQKIYQHDEFYDTDSDPLTAQHTRRESRFEQLYTEDALQQKALEILAGSGTQSTNIVLASHFRQVDNHDSPLTQLLVNELTLNPRHPDTNSLAKATHLSPSTVVEHFEDVVAIAAHEIVRNNRKTALEIVAIGNSLMADPLRRALDKTKPVLTEALDRSTFTTQHHSPNQLPTLDHLELPRWQFAEHAMLAFSDSELDDDFVMRRLKTSQAFTDNTNHNAPQAQPSPVRSMVHQAVAAYQLHTTPKTTHHNSRIESPFQADDLIINWPLNGQTSWSQQLDRRDNPVDRHPDPAIRSQVVRASDLLQLAQLDADVHATRFEIRLRSARLVKELGVTSSIPDQVETLEAALEAAVTGDQPTSDLAILHKTLELSVAKLLDDKSLKRQPARLDPGPAQWADQLTELIDTELPAR
ncbi:MAG: CHASE2 domain-containing protein, partial [Planctomycetaceae bacterium]